MKNNGGKSNIVWNPLTIDQWIAWLAATVVAGISMTVFFYTTFKTNSSFEEYKESETLLYQEQNARLERIENKLDRLLEKK